MDRRTLERSMYDLVMRTCTELPPDVLKAIEEARVREDEGSIAASALDTILASARLSRDGALSVCQDTGAPLAWVEAPGSLEPAMVREALIRALKDLTSEGVLRQNCVDVLTEMNTADNTGAHVPQIHFEPSAGPVRVGLMLKGGGSENVSAQYSLPDEALGAGRDLDGARRCMLDAVFQAQGRGCAPGILGVCVGGDRASGHLLAKMELFRRLDEPTSAPELAELERTVLKEANSLGIGPMGLGGRTTLLGCRIGAAGRHPACYFVTVGYSCWATRRNRVELDDMGRIARWL
jgi:fumarate hydratase class I